MAASVPVVKLPGGVRRALAAFDEDRIAWLDQASAQGPIAGLKLGPVTAWVVSDTAEARRILVEEADTWQRPSAITAPVRLAAGPNLFSERHRRWAALQPQVAPSLRRRSFDSRTAELDDLVAEHVAAIPSDAPVVLRDLTQQLAFASSAWMLFGQRIDPETTAVLVAHLQAVMDWVGDRIGQFSGFSPIALDRRARAMRRQRGSLIDFVDLLIDTTDHDDQFNVMTALEGAKVHGRPLTRPHLRGHVLGLLVVGTETTAATLAWALHNGATRPDAWTRLAEPDPPARPYIDETLRLHPAAWGIPRTPARRGRRLNCGDEQVAVRPGAVVNVYLLAIHRDPNVWPEPDQFRPERHRTTSAEQTHSLIPFGLGPRSCIGQAIALAELAAIVPALARYGSVTVDATGAPIARFALTPAPSTTIQFTSRDAGTGRRPPSRETSPEPTT